MAAFIQANMEEDTIRAINRGRDTPLDRADDMLRAVNVHFQIENKAANVIRDMRRFNSMKRSDLVNMQEYLKALMKKLDQLHVYKVRPHSFACFVKMLKDVQEELLGMPFIKREVEALDHRLLWA